MHIQVSRRWSGFPEIGCSFSTKHPCVLSQLGRPTILRLSWWKPWGKSSWKSWGANMDLDRGFLEIWPPNHGDLIISWCSWWKKGMSSSDSEEKQCGFGVFSGKRWDIWPSNIYIFMCSMTGPPLFFNKGCDSEMDPPSSRFWGGEVFGRQAAISGELSLSPAAVSLRASHRFVSECFARSGIEAWLKGMVVAQRFGTKVIKRCMVTICHNQSWEKSVGFISVSHDDICQLCWMFFTHVSFSPEMECWLQPNQLCHMLPRKRRLASEYGAYLQAQSDGLMRPEHRYCSWVRQQWPKWPLESCVFLFQACFQACLMVANSCFISHSTETHGWEIHVPHFWL